MKSLQYIGISDFKSGMYSSDASELRGKAVHLENVVHDEELGKTVKMKDYSLTQLYNWASEYFLADGTTHTVEDMIFFDPDENEEYLMVLIKSEFQSAVYSFKVETSGILTYNGKYTFGINESLSQARMSVAGKVLRIAYETTEGVKSSLWCGDIIDKKMFFVDGMPQYQFSGFYRDNARPKNSGIYFGTHTLGDDDIETDSEGFNPDDDNHTTGIEYYKNYKLSLQVDDSQESEFADLMVSTVKTNKAPTIPINIDPGFSNRLSKIHIWRKVSKDPIDYADEHELIKTLDVAKDEGSTLFEENLIPLNNAKFAVDYSTGYQESTNAIITQRVLVSNFPAEIRSTAYSIDGQYLKVTYLSNNYYWKITYLGPNHVEFNFNGNYSFNTVKQLISSGALISAGTYGVYGSLRGHLVSTPIYQLTIDDVSYANLFIHPDAPLIVSQNVGNALRSVDNPASIPDTTILSNGIEHLVADDDLCTYRDNMNSDFTLIGTSEVVSQFELKDGGGFTFDFTDDKPFEFGTGQFYSEEYGILRGDFPLYSDAVKYNNRLFVIDGADIRWSEVFKYDMFKPESIYTGKNDFNKLVVFRDVLFAFSENDVVVLNYAGTEVNWRTSDTLDDIGTKYTRSIQVTPVGIFFTDGKGIYVLASTMQMGKQSYTEYQRIDEPIKDLIDFDDLDVEDLVGHYDIKNSRYVLSNDNDGNQYIFSVSGHGWFIRNSADYPSIVRSLSRYGLVKKSNGEVYFTQFVEGLYNDDQSLIYTGWMWVGSPHNTTWWRELYLLLKNGKVLDDDTTVYTATVEIEYEDGTIETLDTIDQSSDYGDDINFEEARIKINEKMKKYRLRINSNYPIFEYDHLSSSYSPTGTY
ncbi:MAG: hypothetical protein H8D23_32735 [Candidatus Brocadiales bacterium]|nr:hypothetical protein [Candidatus Brocadiales bacterium]